LVMEKCGCTDSDAEGALRKAGLDVDLAIKNILDSFHMNSSGYSKSVHSVLRQSARVKGISKDKRDDIARSAELAAQGWEEVGGKAKVKKQAQELKRLQEEEDRRRAFHQARKSQNLRVSKPNKTEKPAPAPAPAAEPVEEKPKEPEPVKEEPKVEEVKPAPVPEPVPVVEEPKKVEPEPEPVPEPVKEEPKKEEEKPAEPAKEAAAPAPTHKRKLTIVRANQVKPEPEPEPEPEKTEVAATEYKPPLVHVEPEPIIEIKPEPEPEVKPEPQPEPEKPARKPKQSRKKAAPAPAPAPEPAAEPVKEEKKPEPVKEEPPKETKEGVVPMLYLMPVDKEALQSLYPNINMMQLMQIQLMPYKYLQAMKDYLIPLGPTGFPDGHYNPLANVHKF